MKKHLLAFGMALVIIAFLFGSDAVRSGNVAAAEYIRALPTGSQIYVDGKAVKFEAYNIEGNNYFRLRDIAMALNGSARQFGIQVSASGTSVNIVTGSAYAPIGGELKPPAAAGVQKAVISSSKIHVNGMVAQVKAYNINGYNYLKLRDLGRAVNFGVSWDGARNRVIIDTAKGYGDLYYVAKYGSDKNPGTLEQPWKTVQKAAGAARAGDTVYIRGGSYNERVIVMNSGAPGSYITFANYPGELPVIDGTNINWGRTGALFDISGRSYIKIRGIRVTHSSWVGIGTPWTGAHHIIIEKCSTYRTQCSGINVSFGSNIIIDGNTIDTPNLSPQDEGLTLGVIDTFEIRNNTIINAQKESLDVKDGCKNGKIYRNTIRDGVGVGIYVDAFSKTSSDIEIYENKVSGVSYGICLANEAGGLLKNIYVHDNQISDCPFGMGIGYFMKNYPHPMDNIVFDGNTLSRIELRGVRLDNPEAKRVRVTNNILGGGKECVPIFLNGGNLAETTIDGNMLNRVVQGHPTGTNYGIIR